MDDEDEFDSFFSGIDDDAAIAALNREEERLAAATQRVDQAPPAKKQKLDNRTVSIPQFSQLPIVLGLENDYFTRTKTAPLQQRNEDSRPRPPQPVKQKSHPVQPQPAIRPPPNVPPQQYYNPPQSSTRPQPLPTVHRPNVPPAVRTPAQRVVSDSHRTTQHQRQPPSTAAPSSSTISSGTSPQQKPHPASAVKSTIPPPPRQHTPQRQLPTATTPSSYVRNGSAGPSGQHALPITPVSSANRRPSVAGQVTPLQAPPIQRNNSLKRQHSSNNDFAQSQGPRPSEGGGGNPDKRLRLELDILRAQLEQTKAHEAELERLYAEEKNARFANLGQVSVVTANMERLKQSHANEVRMLREKRDEAEKAKEELKKLQIAEIERIKTQFTFRQHELETSSRKPPWSAQAKKVYTAKLGTPIKTPAQIRAWNNPSVATQESGPSDVAQTPRRPRHNDGFATPSVVRFTARPSKKPSGMLPGFVNSFAESTPTKPASQRAKDREKGKTRMQDAMIVDDDGKEFFAPASNAPVRSPPSSPCPVPAELNDHPMDGSGPAQDVSVDEVAPDVEADGDVKMGDEAVGAQQEMEMGVEPQNWREELHRLLFAHTAPGGDVPTLHMLLNSPLPPDTSLELQQTYTSACARIIEHFGIVASPIDWSAYMHVFSAGLADLAWVLTSTGALTPLTALFDLLCLLSYSIPAFNSTLLKSPSPATPSRILLTLNHTIRTHLIPTSANHTLAHKVLAMIETFSWGVPEDVVMQFSVVLRGHGVLATLLDKDQSAEFLTHVIRMLSLLATNPELHQHLLAYPNTENGELVEDKDLELLPQLQTICYYLVDPAREGPEHDELKRHVLTLISTLALAHPDAHSILLNSRMLIPSLIIYLSNLSRPLWEDDEEYLSQYPGQTSQVIQQTVRTIALLHYLIFTSDPPFDIRQKLHRPPARHLIGAGHMYVVTLSRCAFTSSPEWIDEEQYIRLEQATGMAKMLLEQVIHGEELDAIWTGLNAEDEEEEEREAQRLHPVDGGME